jgi:hypothetical protein
LADGDTHCDVNRKLVLPEHFGDRDWVYVQRDGGGLMEGGNPYFIRDPAPNAPGSRGNPIDTMPEFLGSMDPFVDGGKFKNGEGLRLGQFRGQQKEDGGFVKVPNGLVAEAGAGARAEDNAYNHHSATVGQEANDRTTVVVTKSSSDVIMTTPITAVITKAVKSTPEVGVMAAGAGDSKAGKNGGKHSQQSDGTGTFVELHENGYGKLKTVSKNGHKVASLQGTGSSLSGVESRWIGYGLGVLFGVVGAIIWTKYRGRGSRNSTNMGDGPTETTSLLSKTSWVALETPTSRLESGLRPSKCITNPREARYHAGISPRRRSPRAVGRAGASPISKPDDLPNTISM